MSKLKIIDSDIRGIKKEIERMIDSKLTFLLKNKI